MKLKHMKKIRVIISLFFLLFLTLFFLGFTGIFPENFIKGVVSLQFIPSILKFFKIFSWVAAGFVVVLILTLLFGRVYCSTICPLGILQDVISYLSKKTKIRKKYKYLKAINWLRYSFLGLALIFLLSGSILVIALLDPYSLFGRIISDIFRPLLLEGNNLLAGLLNHFDVYAMYKIDLVSLHIEVLIIPIIFLGLIIWMSLKKGRLYCNTICPVGTFLGFLSKYSLFKIKLDTNTCTRCGLCESVCKSGCINTKEQKIDFTRCVGCFNCFTVCPFSSVIFKRTAIPGISKQQADKNEATDMSKRNFIAGIGLMLSSLPLLSKAQELVSYNAHKPVKRNNPVTPPGAESTEKFNNACTACHLCVNACPTQVLQPAVMEYGLRGLMQPRMDYHAGFCNFECTICSEICPTGAILPILLEDKKLTQLGKANFVKENCIVETEGTDCGSCAEHCPTQAVHMVDYENNLRIPEVDQDICTGCGACEYACPTHPYKAIYVEGNPVHLRAKKPKEEELDEVEHEDDFPF